MTEGDLGKDYRIIREYILKTISECQKNMVEHEIWWCYAECSCLVNMLKAETLWNTEGIDIRYERKSRSRPSESFDLTCIWASKNNFPVDSLYIFLLTMMTQKMNYLSKEIPGVTCNSNNTLFLWNYLCIGLSFV